MKRELRVGIIGFGMIGKVHAFCCRTFPFYVRNPLVNPRISVIVTSRPETASAAAELLDCRGSNDFRDVTENPDIDVVNICTPNRAHREALLSAITHQKYIYCDKPITASLEDALEVESLLTKKDAAGNLVYTKTNQMTFHLRFIPAIRRAKQLLTEGRLGRIYEYRIAYKHASNANPMTPFKWKHDVGGGVIRDLGSHLLDLTDYLIGLPSEIIADAEIVIPRRPDPSSPGTFRDVKTEDSFILLTRGFDPATGERYRGQIEGTKLAVGSEDELTLEISGEKGSIRFSLADSHYLDFYETSRPDHPNGGESGWIRIAAGARFEPPHTDFPSPKSIAGWSRYHAASYANFLNAAGAEKSAEPDLLQGVRIQKFLDVMESSAKERRWLKTE